MIEHLIPKSVRTYSMDVAYYALIVIHQLVRLRGLKQILKANYGIDHGGYAFASKYSIQEYVGHEYFPKTVVLPVVLHQSEKISIIKDFVAEHGYPFILKPDQGYVGKGVFKIDSFSDVERLLGTLSVDYLIQAFVPGQIEFGLFYVRDGSEIIIPSINQKYYPSVVGDGTRSIGEIARSSSRYTPKWEAFLKQPEEATVLANGEERILSFIGSNTLGSAFVDVSHLANAAIRQRLKTMFSNAPGVNFSRLDVKADSVAAFERGEFYVIEVNGIASQPTSMLDHAHSFLDIIQIMNTHALLLVRVARHHAKQDMTIMNWIPFLKATRRLMKNVERQYARSR